MLLNRNQLNDINELNALEQYLNLKIKDGKFNYYVNFSKDIRFSLNAENILFSDLIAGTFTLMHNLVLLFPITTKEGVGALNYVIQALFNEKKRIEFNDSIIIHHLYFVDTIDEQVTEWIRNMPLIKSMLIQDIILPDSVIINHSIIYWKHISLYQKKRI